MSMKNNILDKITQTTDRYGRVMGYKTQPLQEMSMRDMMGVMRKLNEATDGARTLSQAEIDREQEKMLNYFQDDNVNIEFQPLEVYDNAVFWAGKINGQLLFSYIVAPDEKDKKVDIKYLDGFDPTNPDNDKIIKKVQAYFNDFYKYWRDNELQIENQF